MHRFTIAAAAMASVLGTAGPAYAQASGAPPSGASGSQTVVPPPAPAGTADVPGGSARNGVIKPPRQGAGTMPVIRPPATGTMPVLHPPSSRGNATPVQPK